jgi:lipopolysaccharide biosynthesis protein
MAREHGIEGFCYYHYWFGGKRLLERPFNEVLRSGEPDFPFCLCWANESWTGIWHGAPDRILMEQTYPGPEDDKKHFYALVEAFADRRYLRIGDRPVFLVLNPAQLPDPIRTTNLWRELAVREGLKGLYLVGLKNAPWVPEEHGFDAASTRGLGRLDSSEPRPFWKLKRALRHAGLPRIYSYRRKLPFLLRPEARRTDFYPTLIPNWDNTPRSGANGLVLHGSTPELFRAHLHATLEQVKHKSAEHRLIFIKSWNEWAEGNHLEPDLRFGRSYLEVIRGEVVRD